MASITAYGAYVPTSRAPLGEIQAFEGRPGRPRSKALATPALDEDVLTMAWEAATQAIAGGASPAALITVTQSSPFGMRKLSRTLARALAAIDDPEAVACYDLAGHPGSLLDAFGLAEGLVAAGAESVLVVVSDHVVSYEERVCDMLSAGGAAAFVIAADGFAALGASARDSKEIFDVWRLGTEPEVRYRMEVLFDGYLTTQKGALTALEAATGNGAASYGRVAVSQPHPQVVRGLGKLGFTDEAIAGTVFVGDLGNMGAASLGVSLALALDGASAGQTVLAFGYGAGEGIAQEISVTAAPATCGIADLIADGAPISLSTYYRWTRGRQQKPH